MPYRFIIYINGIFRYNNQIGSWCKYVCVCEYVWMCANVTFHSPPVQARGMRKLRFYIDFGIAATLTHILHGTWANIFPTNYLQITSRDYELQV